MSFSVLGAQINSLREKFVAKKVVDQPWSPTIAFARAVFLLPVF